MSKKQKSQIQEKSIAESLGWEVVSGSGARFQPGDVISQEWLGECKTHVEVQPHIQFDRTVWDKICKEAISCMRRPVYFSDDGSQNLSHTWAIFSYDVPEGQAEVRDFPKVTKSSIRFNHSELFYDRIAGSENMDIPVIYRSSFSNCNVSISSFYDFKKIVEMI